MVRTDFVGRQPELALLSESLDAALAGEPRLVLCRGEPGIGKTRLAEEFSVRAAARGVRTAWGRGVDSEGAPPYWPWRQVFRTVNESSLAERLPALSGGLPAPVPAGGVSYAAERFEQFEALARLLREITGVSPLVIVLDDLQWAGEPSLLLLQHLAWTLTDERLMIVANHRETEPIAPQVVDELARQPLTRVLPLTGLQASDVACQLALATGREVTEAEARDIRSRTGGNPFFVGEVARSLLGSPSAVASGMTTGLRDALNARLSRLSDGCVKLVQAAAVIGSEFSVAVVAAIIDIPLAECLDVLDEAVAAGLVEPGGRMDQHFVHTIVRDAIEAGLPTSDRVRLHRRAADALVAIHAGSLDDHVFDIARHWAAAAVAGDASVAAGWVERAGEQAMRGLAFEEATRLFRLALEVGGQELTDLDRTRTLLSLATALHASGDLTGRLNACQQVAAIARRVGRPDLIAEAALILEGVFGQPESDVAARRLCQEALAGLPPTAVALRARLSGRLASAYMYLGEFEDAVPPSETAMELAEASGDGPALAAAMCARQLVCEGPEGLSEREHLAGRMLSLSRSHALPKAEVFARLWLVDACFERGDLAGALEQLTLLIPVTEQIGDPWARWHVLRGQGVLAQAQARFADVRVLAEQAFTLIARTREPFAALPRGALLQGVGHHTGYDATVLAANRLGTEPVDVADFAMPGVTVVVAPAHILVEVGRLAEAATLYRSLGPVSGWRPQPHGRIAALAFGVAVAIALGVREDVAALQEQLDAYRDLHVASGAGAVAYFGPVRLWLGLAASFVGELDEAVDHLEGAVRSCAINGAPGFQAEAQLELATVLARRGRQGDSSRARSLVDDATRRARELGMPPITLRGTELLQKLSTQREQPLTKRELEVAELVAGGFTNRQIAERLFLSERTAQNHVQHILAKLALSNRSQLAVWMTEQKMSTPAE